MDYGRALRICRAALKVSQQEVAKRARITTSYLSLIESGKRSPSLDTLGKICRAMDVPIHLVMLLAAGRENIPGSERKYLRGLAESLLHFLADRKAAQKRR